MSGLWILIAFFAFVMTAVMAVGYAFYLRMAQRSPEIPAALSNEPALPPAGAAFLGVALGALGTEAVTNAVWRAMVSRRQ